MTRQTKKVETRGRPARDDKKPYPADVVAGQRLRQRRVELGLSQDALGKAVGVTFQQVQKYELGKNRISASRLQQFADLLRVAPAYFFTASGVVLDPATDRETLEVMRLYQSLPKPARLPVRHLMRSLVEFGEAAFVTRPVES